MAIYELSQLYKKLPHDKLKSKLCSDIYFAFTGGDKTIIRLCSNATVYWRKNEMETWLF